MLAGVSFGRRHRRIAGGLSGTQQLGTEIIAWGEDCQAVGFGASVAAAAVVGVGAGLAPGQGCQPLM